MGFGDKFKDLTKQAQDAVAVHKEQITQAVGRAGVMADQRTGGKYADTIAKAGQKAERVVDKLAGERDAGSEAPPSGGATASAEEPSVGHAPRTAPEPPPATDPPSFA